MESPPYRGVKRPATDVEVKLNHVLPSQANASRGNEGASSRADVGAWSRRQFHASPYRGVHHGGVSLWPCSSRRQVTRHGRQPGGANASVGGSSLAIAFVPTP